jgi:limonene-1,2-epoxide hydrolase
MLEYRIVEVSMPSARDVVHRFHAAIGAKDFAAARRLLLDDLSFEGPLDTFHNADDYIAAIKKLSRIVKRIEIKKLFVDGNDVCVLYDMNTNTPAGTSFISEWFRIKGNKISEVRVVFDARSFAAISLSN